MTGAERQRLQLEVSLIEAPNRRSKSGLRHRRHVTLSKAAFWTLALVSFRVSPYGSSQEELL